MVEREIHNFHTLHVEFSIKTQARTKFPMLEHTLSQKRVTHFEKSIKEGCNGGKEY